MSPEPDHPDRITATFAHLPTRVMSARLALGCVLALAGAGCKLLPSTTDTTQSKQEQSQVLLSSANHSFGAVGVGASVDVLLLVQHSGKRATAEVAASGLSSPFTFKGGSYPGTGGTCGSTISSNCMIVLNYSPTSAGSHSATLTLAYSGKSDLEIFLSGTASLPASLSISDETTYDFGSQVVGSTTSKTFTVTNSGGLSATSVSGSTLSAPYAFKGGSYPGTGGTCASIITSTCTMVVTFSPTALGAATDTLTLSYNSGTATTTATRPLTGTGSATAGLSISDGPAYNFGSKSIGSSTDYTFTVTPTGSASSVSGAGLSGGFSFKGGAYPGTGGTCGSSIAAACTIVITYSPQTAGFESQTITLSYYTGIATAQSTRIVQGTGTASATLTLSESPAYDFGNKVVGSSTDKIFTVAYAGGVSATSVTGSGLAAPFSFKGGSYPGTGGSCGGTITAVCTIVVTYDPSAGVTSTDTIVLDYNDGTTTQTATRDVSGTGVTVATLSISDGMTYDYGTHSLGSSTDKVFTVTYSGGAPATSVTGSGLAAPYTFKGGAYPGTGGTCGTTISGTCTIVVTYSPTGAGVDNDTVSIDFHNGLTSTSATRAVTGTGAAAATLTLSDAPNYDFGTKVLTSSTDKTFTVTYAGGVSATSVTETALSPPYSFKGGFYPGTGGSCGSTISADCTIVVTFSPTSAGLHSSTLALSYNNGTSTQSVSRPLAGTGASPAVLTLSESPSYDFGSKVVGSATDKVLTVSYTGGVSATSVTGSGLAAPFTYKDGSYPGTGGSCGATIAASCTIVVTYTAAAAVTSTDTISIDYDDGLTTQSATRDVSGTGVAVASLSISNGPTYDYSTQAIGSATDKTFTVTYSGGATATGLGESGLAAPFAFKGGSYPGTGGTCGTTIAANCTIVVTYSPTAAVMSSDTIVLDYNNGLTTTTATRDVQGTGAAASTLTISDATTYAFGNKVLTSSTDKTFTVTFAGGVSATSVSAGSLSAPYSYKGGFYPGTGGTCGSTIAADCTIVVNYSPTSAGLSSATLTLSYNDGTGTMSATRPMTGTGTTVAVLAISDGPVYDFGTKAVASSTDKTFTITNSGGTSATVVTPVALAAPYSFKGGTYPGTGGTCSATIVSGNCSIVVTYNPAAGGMTTDTLVLDYDDGLAAAQVSRPIQGTASAALATLAISNQPTYSWGTRPTGSTTDATLTVTYAGGQAATSVTAATISAPFSFKGGNYPGTGGTCGTSISANCTIVLSFDPAATASYSDTLLLNYNNGATTTSASLALAGNGGSVATLTVSDASTYNFGQLTVGRTLDKTFTVTNSGDTSASSMTASGLAGTLGFKGGSYPGTGGTCGTTLAGGFASCTLVVTYTPSAAAMTSQTLSVDYNNGTANTSATRAITGTGLTITQLAPGANHTCALYSNGGIKCWGADDQGQLGNDANLVGSVTPVTVLGISSAVSVASGDSFSCAVLSNGTVKCWGKGTSGQLGYGGSSNQPTPVSISGSITNATAVTAGGTHACITQSAAPYVSCWGEGSAGQIGDNNNTDRVDPTAVFGVAATASSISAGTNHTCMIVGGAAYCWGMGANGRIGDGFTADRNVPTAVSGIAAGATGIAAGGSHSCAVVSGGAKCWGADGTYGQVGDNAGLSDQVTPQDVSGLTANITSVTAGLNHSCALESGGTAQCWGADYSGQVGDNASLVDQATPAAVSGATLGSEIKCSGDGCYLRRSSGAPLVWGDNGAGQLGTGDIGTREAVPVGSTYY